MIYDTSIVGRFITLDGSVLCFGNALQDINYKCECDMYPQRFQHTSTRFIRVAILRKLEQLEKLWSIFSTAVSFYIFIITRLYVIHCLKNGWYDWQTFDHWNNGINVYRFVSWPCNVRFPSTPAYIAEQQRTDYFWLCSLLHSTVRCRYYAANFQPNNWHTRSRGIQSIFFDANYDLCTALVTAILFAVYL